MATILSDSKNNKNTTLESLFKNDDYIIGIRGHGEGVGRKGGKFTVKDVKRVLFRRGEERNAIKLFVDANKVVLISDSKFRQKSWFYPPRLFKYYLRYLMEGKLDDDIPSMYAYAIKTSKKHTRNVKFCQYMRERCPELLKNPESLLHDCDFLNKYYHNKIEEIEKTGDIEDNEDAEIEDAEIEKNGKDLK